MTEAERKKWIREVSAGMGENVQKVKRKVKKKKAPKTTVNIKQVKKIIDKRKKKIKKQAG